MIAKDTQEKLEIIRGKYSAMGGPIDVILKMNEHITYLEDEMGKFVGEMEEDGRTLLVNIADELRNIMRGPQ